LFLIAPATAFAQETRGSIEGVVKDSTGGALPGVSVVAKHVATNSTVTAVTDATGVYRFPTVVPGLYTVSATLQGFKPAEDKVEVLVGRLYRVTLIMDVAGIAVSETVRAESPIVDTKQNAVTQTVSKGPDRDAAELEPRLPVGPHGPAWHQLRSDISGSRATGIMIDGASQSENRFVIDGQDTTNLRTGLCRVRAWSWTSSSRSRSNSPGYNAEFRATTGGVVSVITKSGTNAYHGTAAMDYNGKALNWLRGDIRPSFASIRP
jgi:hypothetical protein